jgi:hypothetical protein
MVGAGAVPSGPPSSPIAKEKRELEGDEVILFILPLPAGRGQGMVSRMKTGLAFQNV